MKTISITQLRAATAYWVRAAAKESFIVTDRGKKAAILERRPIARAIPRSKLPRM